jgi:hypothetical protein
MRNNIDAIVNAALANAQRTAAVQAKATKPVLKMQVVRFQPLVDFTVESRPMASKRKAHFTPVNNWTQNERLRHAAEGLKQGDNTKYVEAGDTLYKVRLKAS